MRRAVLLWAACSAAFAPVPLPRRKAGPPDDLRAMQGSWFARRVASAGEWLDGEVRLAVRGDRVRFNDGDEARLVLGRDGGNKTFDFTPFAGTRAGRETRCIYRLDGDRLTVIWHLGPTERPTRLDGSEMQTAGAVFERRKP